MTTLSLTVRLLPISFIYFSLVLAIQVQIWLVYSQKWKCEKIVTLLKVQNVILSRMSRKFKEEKEKIAKKIGRNKSKGTRLVWKEVH